MREWWRELQELRPFLEHPKVLRGPRGQKEFSYWPGCSWASVKGRKVCSHLTVEIPRDFWGGIAIGQITADKILLCSPPPAQRLLEQDREPSLSLQWSPQCPSQREEDRWPRCPGQEMSDGRSERLLTGRNQGKAPAPVHPFPVGVQKEKWEYFLLVVCLILK